MKNKNILYLTRSMGTGGTEKVILQLCENLKEEFNRVIVASAGGVNEKKLTELDIRHYTIPDVENKDPITLFKTFVYLMKIIRKHNIHIIHTHHRMSLFYSKILRKFTKCVLIHTAHNTFLDKKLITSILLKNTKTIAVGEEVKKNLVNYYKLNSELITVIYNGIDDKIIFNKIDYIEKYRLNNIKVIANIGRLSKQKGFEYYLRAIPYVVQKRKNVRFLVVGDGEEYSNLFNLVRELNIEEYVMFTGYCSDVQNLMSQVDFIVLSSLWEGLPLTPIEAFSVNKTIIATEVDGTKEIISNNINGILIPSKDEVRLSEAMIRLLDDEELLTIMNIEANKTYKEKFTLQDTINKYFYYYKNIL